LTERDPAADAAREPRELARELRERLGQGDVAGAESLLEHEPPADVAEAIEQLPHEDKGHLFEALDSETAGAVLSELSPTSVQAIAESAPESLARAAAEMEPDEVADLLDTLTPQQRSAVLESLPREEATKARRLLAHPPDTAGGIMTTEFVLLAEGITAAKAIEITQRSRERETIAHLFVCDKRDRLLGHLPLHKLVFSRPERRLKELVEPEVVTVTPDTDREEVVRLATRYDLDVVAVVDRDGRLVGVITADDILKAGQQEADEDMYRLAGTAERDPVHATVLRSTRLRLPWLYVSLAGGLLDAFLMSRFAGALKVIQVAFFVPLIPLMGGNVAIQSATIVVRGLAVGDIRRANLPRFIGKQWAVTLLLALSCGMGAGLLAAALPWATGNLPLVVGGAVALAIVVAGMLGTLLPFGFEMLGIDPAVSAGPFVTIINDMVCITIYLALGTALA